LWLGMAALALIVASARLEIRTSNLDLIDPSLPPVAAFLRVAHDFGNPNMIVVVLEGDNPADLRQAVDTLGSSLAKITGVRALLYRLPLPLGKIAGDAYFHSHDQKMFFLWVQPADPLSRADHLAPLVESVRLALRTTAFPPGIRVGLTGTPIYALDDRDTITRDITKLSFLSLGLIALLFISLFHNWRRPLLATVTLLVAVVASALPISFIPGHLTLLSAFFVSILFGLGIDGSIHLIARVEELGRDGQSELEACVQASQDLARSLLTSMATTVAALLALLASGFRGFAELGLIAACGMVLCWLASLTLLPALLVLVGARKWPKEIVAARADNPLRGSATRSLRVSAFLLIGITAALAIFGGPGYDSDYLNLQAQGSETVRLERAMVENSPFSPQFAIFDVATRTDLLALVEKLRSEESVAHVTSALDQELLAALATASGLAAPMPSLKSLDGRLAVLAYPKENVWEPQAQQRFVDRMRALDPNVTGMPVLGHFMVERSLRALQIAGSLAALAIILITALDFRALRPMAWALTPTALTVAALPGLLKLCGLSWNPLSIMAIPIILGIAVDDGVHLVHRFLQERGDLDKTLRGAGRSVILTSLTTLAAFGSLALTSHRGLASFAMVLCLGVGLALIFSLGVLPALLRRSAATPEA
jgi:predicted RND superfamily exporter protein